MLTGYRATSKKEKRNRHHQSQTPEHDLPEYSVMQDHRSARRRPETAPGAARTHAGGQNEQLKNSLGELGAVGPPQLRSSRALLKASTTPLSMLLVSYRLRASMTVGLTLQCCRRFSSSSSLCCTKAVWVLSLERILSAMLCQEG